jgi:hypothetical protein
MLVEDSLSTVDLAYDCIAELFQRVENGDLIRIRTYFESIDIEAITDQEVLFYLRRLVFSAVDQGLIRIYSNLDPHLGKILRNLRLSIQNLGTFAEISRLGEQCLVPQLCEPLSHLPVVDLDLLQVELSSRLRGVERIPEILSALSRYLREQSEHSRQVPLVRLALAIRWLYAVRQNPSDLSHPADEPLAQEDLLTIIQASCSEIRRSLVDGYAANGKVSIETADNYMEAIQRYLKGKLDCGDPHLSLFESLRSLIPTLTKAGYDREHRSRMEYLARKTEKSVVQSLRKG